MASIEGDNERETVRKGDGPATAKFEPGVTLDADTVVKNLIAQRDKVNKLYNEMISTASRYKAECDAFIQRISDVLHERVDQ
jgi:hypothetical protein